ncbi:MAG: hypothetical protein KKH04_20205 [Proteobacteria bacterium]|nr:hypothetical protein [Pseudomonadota bacterium]
MKKLSFLFFMIPLFSVVLFFSILARAQTAPERQSKVQGDVDPYQVTLYRNINYSDPIMSWKLTPGMRMLKVPVVNKIPFSIFLGLKVGVLLFPDNNFSSKLQGVSSYEVKFGASNEPSKKYLIPYFRFNNSTPQMYESATFTQCLLIIHRKDIGDFLGVYLVKGNRGH